MNTLVLLLMTAVPGEPVMQVQSVVQTPSAPIVTTEAGESSWWSRFRNRPGLLTRLRNRFGWSQTESYPPAITTAPSMTTSGRLVPTPIDATTLSTPPRITYTTTPAAALAPADVRMPQPMPVGK
jgi:hypothetical protein